MKGVSYLTKRKASFFYGYWILAAAFIILFIHGGCSFYAFGLFVASLQREFGWSRAGIMTAATIHTLIMGASGILIGRIVDRYGPRLIIIIGAMIICPCFILMSRMQQLGQFYFLYGLAGIGFAAVGFIPVSYLVFKWFRKRRGLAIGISGIGIGAGGFAMPLIIGGLLIPNFGWRNAYLAIGLFAALFIIPLDLLVIRTKPEDIGLLADGDEGVTVESLTHSSPHQQTDADGLTMRMAFRTRAFWLLSLSSAAFGFSCSGIIQNQVPHLEDIGFPIAVAAGALGAVGIGSGVGKLVFGVICDWIRPKYVWVIGICCQMVALVMLMNVNSSSSVVSIWMYAILFGLGLGSWLPAMSLLTSTNFGMVAYATISAAAGLLNTIGGSAGGLIAGYIFDMQQSYHLAFIIFMVLYALAMVATLALRRPGIIAENPKRGST
ncbi:MAG: MFS transporter [Chloroflexota bacterium]